MLQVGNERAYNVQEVAVLLNVTPVTVRSYIRQGKIRAQKVGRALYIAEGNLQEFLRG